MPVRRRIDKRRDPVTGDESAWLRGDCKSGFVEFKSTEDLQKLWEAYGDQDELYWKPGMSYPDKKQRSSLKDHALRDKSS